jgi:hypothetical protein
MPAESRPHQVAAHCGDPKALVRFSDRDTSQHRLLLHGFLLRDHEFTTTMDFPGGHVTANFGINAGAVSPERLDGRTADRAADARRGDGVS